MTAIKEQFMQMLPQMQKDVASMSDSDVQQIINLWIKIKPEKKLAADGILHHLAEPAKVQSEEGAWKRAAVEKYRREMVGSDEAD